MLHTGYSPLASFTSTQELLKILPNVGIDISNGEETFVEKEVKLLQYVRDRSLVDIEKAKMNFDIYEKDVVERHIRIPKLKDLYERKCENLRAFQNGKDLWKNRAYRR